MPVNPEHGEVCTGRHGGQHSIAIRCPVATKRYRHNMRQWSREHRREPGPCRMKGCELPRHKEFDGETYSERCYSHKLQEQRRHYRRRMNLIDEARLKELLNGQA